MIETQRTVESESNQSRTDRTEKKTLGNAHFLNFDQNIPIRRENKPEVLSKAAKFNV